MMIQCEDQGEDQERAGDPVERLLQAAPCLPWTPVPARRHHQEEEDEYDEDEGDDHDGGGEDTSRSRCRRSWRRRRSGRGGSRSPPEFYSDWFII